MTAEQERDQLKRTLETCVWERTDARLHLEQAKRQRDALLAALTALVFEVEQKDNPRDEGASSDSDVMDAARAAIAKAKG